MSDQYKLMCVLAHPDDESLGVGGTLAKYADEGIETYLVTATRGEYGWFGAEEDNPGPEALGKIREKELQNAADVLGIQELVFLDYIDGQLDQADHNEVIGKILKQIRRIQPDVVITFDPYDAYGHPDHIAISQFTTSAIVRSADANYENDYAPYCVSKLYYFAETKEELDIYEEAFGELVMQIDGQARGTVGWAEWAITTQIDTAEYWEQVWKAVSCHQTQLPGYQALKNLSSEKQKRLWHSESFYRVMSMVNGGRQIETDLFEGIRTLKQETVQS